MKNQSIEASFQNDMTLLDYYYRFRKIATSMFEWLNLPESCNSRWLEKCLFDFGKAAFLYDETYGYINTEAITSGNLNMYGLPTKINCHSFTYDANRDLYTGFKKDKIKSESKEDECILIMNNSDMVPTSNTISLFVKRLRRS